MHRLKYNVTVKDIIKMRQLQNQNIQFLWCDEQVKDVQKLIDLMEHISEISMNSHTDSMSRDLLKQTKTEFVQTILEISENYRYVLPENV